MRVAPRLVCDQFLDLAHCCLVLLVPLELAAFLGEIPKDCRLRCKVGNETARNCTIPRKVWRSVRLADGSLLEIASAFLASNFRPSLVRRCQKNGSLLQAIMHLSGVEPYTSILRSFHDSSDICVMFQTGFIIDCDCSYAREVSKCFIDFSLKDILRIYESKR